MHNTPLPTFYWHSAPDGQRWKSYSQKSQDLFVLEVLQFKKNGFYVDLACSEPLYHSNTASLEKYFGWNGICIDGNKDSLRRWPGVRNCSTLYAIVDEIAGRKAEFIEAHGLGGIVADDVDNNFHFRKSRIELARSNNLTHFGITTTLTDILSFHNAPQVVDYLSLDVEGAETRILRSGILNNYKFLAVTVERPSAEAHALLISHKYHLAKSVDSHGLNRAPFTESFYVHSSVATINPYVPVRPKPPRILRKNT